MDGTVPVPGNTRHGTIYELILIFFLHSFSFSFSFLDCFVTEDRSLLDVLLFFLLFSFPFVDDPYMMIIMIWKGFEKLGEREKGGFWRTAKGTFPLRMVTTSRLAGLPFSIPFLPRTREKCE